MNEEKAWENFCKTGNIDEYLLYKGVLTNESEKATDVALKGNVNGTD